MVHLISQSCRLLRRHLPCESSPDRSLLCLCFSLVCFFFPLSLTSSFTRSTLRPKTHFPGNFGSNMSGNNVSSRVMDILSGIVPLMKLISLTVIGLLLAHPKTQLVPRATFRLLSKLVFALFLPCLIFTELGESITLDNIVRWWFIPVNVLLSTVIGSFIGYIVVLVCRPPPEFTRVTIVMTAFGNTGNLLLAIVSSVCHSKNNPFGSGCHSRGVSYVSFAQWVAVILVYTVVYHMMEPPLEYYEVVEDEGGVENLEIEEINVANSNDVSRPLLVEAEWPGIEEKETEHCKTPFIARVFNSISSYSQTSFPEVVDLMGETGGESSSPRSLQCLAEPRVIRRMRVVAEQTPVKHILQPPTIASLLAIVVGSVPQLKSIVFGYEAPLSFITDSLNIMASAMVPSVMLVLGGMLSEGPRESTLGLRTTVGITVARLLVLPLVGIGIVMSADKLGLISPDPMFKFVLLLQYSTPSAILLGAIASLRGYAVREASALLFWQHVFALLSLTFYIIVFFKLTVDNVQGVL